MPTRTFRRLLAVALLAICTGASRADGQPQKPDSGSGITIRVPDAIADFRMIHRKDYDDRAFGTMLRYQRPHDSLYVDLFVYPGPDFASGCDLACAREALRREGDDFIGAFPMLVERQYVDTIALASDSALAVPADAPWRLGRHMRFAQMRKGQPEWSDFDLYYLPGFRVKLRASYPRDTAFTTVVSRFATAAIPALTGRDARATDVATADSAADLRHIMVSTTLPGAPAANFALVARLLAKAKYEIADSSSAEWRLLTAPRYAPSPDADGKKRSADESPGVRLLVRLAPKGDSTTVEISGESPTRPGWTDAKAAQLVEMLSVMELAAKLPEPKKKKR